MTFLITPNLRMNESQTHFAGTKYANELHNTMYQQVTSPKTEVK